MSTDTILISIISGLLVIIQSLVGYIFINTVKDLKERLNRQDERFESYKKEKEAFDYRWRHDVYVQDQSKFELRLGMVERLPEKVDHLWDRVMNGVSK